MTADQAAPQHRGAPRWMKILLFASLAANLAVVGVLAAAAWRFRHGAPAMAAATSVTGAGNLLGFAATLPAERRVAIWRDTVEHRRALRQLRGDVRVARQAIRAQLLADPFDPAGFAAAQRQLNEAESRARAEAQQVILTIVGKLSRDERAAFAQWQSDGPPGRQKGPGFWKRYRDGSPRAPDDGTGAPIEPVRNR